MNQFSSSC